MIRGFSRCPKPVLEEVLLEGGPDVRSIIVNVGLHPARSYHVDAITNRFHPESLIRTQSELAKVVETRIVIDHL